MGFAEFEPAQKVRRNLVTALISALLEWFLILFLFIGAGISYVITKFARDCELQTPCVLCSRLDHVLGEEKTGYHWDLMCKHHKSEISSLVHCHAHNKLVDVHKMCESCLFSFATTNKSNAETYRLLVGKLGEEFSSDSDREDTPLEGEDVGLLRSRKCGCCDQPWAPRERSRAKELIHTRFAGSEAGSEEPEMVFSDSVECDHEVARTVSHSRECERDHLPHIGYTELKINSDTESEALHSDDDGASLVSRANVIHERVVEPRIVIVNKMDLALERLLDPETEPRTSLLKSRVEEDEEISELVDFRTREQESRVKEDEETLVDCEAREKESQVKEDEETVQLVDRENREQESVVKDDEETVQLVDCKTREQESQVKLVEEIAELVNCEAQEQESKLNEDEETVEQKTTESIGHGLEELLWQEVGNEASHTTAAIEITIQPSLPSAQIETIVEVLQSSDVATRTIEVGEASVAKFEEVSERGALPKVIAEISDNAQQITTSLELGDAYKLAIDTRGKQLSGILADQWLGKDSSRATEDLRILLSQLSANRGLDPPFSDISPKLSVHSDDAKSLDGMQRLQKRISLERNESGLSLDGSLISEIDGESGVDRLRRQLEHDKKLMAALYKELEEERSASAVATNQTMAMITRLQEEKAALHMEALQYLRMMEEQAEYDDDELHKSNDLLAEREKEVQDLEVELEFYRTKFPNEQYLENFSETSGDLKITDIGVDNSEQYNAAAKLPELEDEKTFIAESLKRLEKTLDLLNDEDELRYDCSEEHDTSVSGRNDKAESVERNSTDLASVGVMVSGLNKRLEALEADRRFLEHTISSLRNGEEGVQFVQEIASHLRELRTIAMRKDQTIA